MHDDLDWDDLKDNLHLPEDELTAVCRGELTQHQERLFLAHPGSFRAFIMWCEQGVGVGYVLVDQWWDGAMQEAPDGSLWLTHDPEDDPEEFGDTDFRYDEGAGKFVEGVFPV